MDAATGQISAEQRLLRYFGMNPKRQHISSLHSKGGRTFSAAVWAHWNHANQHALSTGKPYTIELEARRKGDRIWLCIRGEAIRAASGRVTGVRGTMEDITPRKKCEPPWMRFACSLALIGDAIIITDAESSERGGPRIVFVNQAFTAQTGYLSEEAIGRSPRFLLGPKTNRIECKRIRQALRDWKPVRAELLCYRKTGEEFWAELDMVPISDELGWHTHWVTVQREITDRKRAETTLRESEERYRQLMDRLPLPVHTCDAEGRVLFHNAAARALWGRDPDKHQGRWCGALKALTPDGRRLKRDSCPVAISMATGLPVRGGEVVIERRNHTRSHVMVFPDPTINHDGKVTGAIIIQVDITALKDAERALRTNARQLRTISRAVEQSPASVLITNPQGKISYVNPKFAEISGYRKQEVIGKNPRFLNSGVHPRAFFAEMWRTIKSGRNWRGEICNRKKNGELFWEFAVISPIHDSNGVISHFVAIKEDITNQRRAHEALRDREERLRSILNTVGDAIISLDEKGRILEGNPSANKMFGYSEPELLGQQIHMLIPALRDEKLKSYVRSERTEEKAMIDIFGREFQGRHRNGSLFFIDLAVSEVDHTRTYTAVIRDITHRKQLESEVLSITENERQRIAADLHDGICQELMGISFLASAVEQDLRELSPALARKAHDIHIAVSKAAEHTKDVARGMNPVVAEGGALMHALDKLARTTASIHRVHCTFVCPAPVSIRNTVIANQLYRIANEAVSNAIRHARAQKLTVELRRHRDGIVMVIRDNGKGIPIRMDQANGLGLRAMHYRAGLIGADLSVKAMSRGGTCVTCRLRKTGTER